MCFSIASSKASLPKLRDALEVTGLFFTQIQFIRQYRPIMRFSLNLQGAERPQAVLFEGGAPPELSACSAASIKFREAHVSLDFFGSFFHQWKK